MQTLWIRKKTYANSFVMVVQARNFSLTDIFCYVYWNGGNSLKNKELKFSDTAMHFSSEIRLKSDSWKSDRTPDIAEEEQAALVVENYHRD